jgi:hypothetical protein
VATHAAAVARLLAHWRQPPMVQMLGLLHDAADAYTGGIITPMRQAICAEAGGDTAGAIEVRLLRAILARFRVEGHGWPLVKAAGAAVFAAEWRDLMEGPCPSPADPAPFAVKPQPSARAEQDFLDLFARLEAEAGLTLPPNPTST